ncbi:DUF4123 domain-containing protein [Pseudomonas sp. P155]|uniref:DUF4123 domain-containing protein n=1 Tax=Pseudomonas neuropathica TaxID=2730425 RepID=A0ABS0BU92_9PSED|nr:DUF4123 domain-containing protein [Pseudomonas neuropathica]MBF6036096.1 DUF4123 domain-containing protein [Pseudomonas neuropathica]
MQGHSSKEWLQIHPLNSTEKLFAIFSNVSDSEPFKAWQVSAKAQAPSPIWADTIYAEWDAVMPFVGIVPADSEFLDWVATTESLDWGWLAVSSASQEVVVEHFRSLTQVLMPDGKAVFFRFWDGRFLLPILQSDAVDAAQLLPVISRGLINGQALEIGGRAPVSGRVFPWWAVPDSVLASAGDEVRVGNAVQWLSEEHPALFEAFPEVVLRCKVGQFFQSSTSEESSQSALLAYLLAESE